MRKLGRDIPAAELEVLAALWRLGKGTVRDVLDMLQTQGRRLAYTTVLTLLARLVERGYVRSSRDKQAHVYEPRISRDKVAAARLGALVEQLGEGQTMPFILHLVEANRLSHRDITKLRELLSRLEVEGRKGGEKP